MIPSPPSSSDEATDPRHSDAAHSSRPDVGAGRRWTRRRTRIGGQVCEDDWTVVCDSWVVGRTHRVHPGFVRVGQWGWSVHSYPACSGYAETLDEALERIRQGVRFGPDGRPETVQVQAWRRGESGGPA